MTSASSPKEVANALYDAYCRHDHRAILALYCDDATHDEVSQLKTKQGPAEIAVGMQKLFSWLPDVRWEVKSMIVGGDGTVAVAYVMRATAPQKNGTAEAKTISLRGVQLVQVEDGRIRHSEDYWDAATFQRQVS
ncbi:MULTISPECIES: nuclear transport factor 2 family protein [unclassified Bradyrhizobium]|uniref:nuclear transport factor 2 family protein n=1 Tax=unclassified Bradyrhizobium TaxID=2631580 RepID=UPI0020B1A922|nr:MULTISPECIES: nuclear transport factor 2 family protein [unclassified Bradyrhizobium]MCP3397803.1 nuclear transport factor 2 family protein [Bradyrhizobium sp. CCGB20]MCP3401939.1 nuclear transport factor 2 family protein [Bradyrhizobium sp. CCGB20]MCP3406392.1 nuclear transport factor 2 family protein [Bradyrhizobium sp. CCGB01]MCP3410424.1 nuclear transport factor 2 family protein [Bradyrhizobium sp. CCGB01]